MYYPNIIFQLNLFISDYNKILSDTDQLTSYKTLGPRTEPSELGELRGKRLSRSDHLANVLGHSKSVYVLQAHTHPLLRAPAALERDFVQRKLQSTTI